MLHVINLGENTNVEDCGLCDLVTHNYYGWIGYIEDCGLLNLIDYLCCYIDPKHSTALHRVAMEKDLSMCGQRGMEGGTMTLVLLMAMLPVYTPLPWDQQTRQEGRLAMMRTVQGKWPSPSASTLTLSPPDQMTLGMHIIKW